MRVSANNIDTIPNGEELRDENKYEHIVQFRGRLARAPGAGRRGH